jgi:hypothetical protein
MLAAKGVYRLGNLMPVAASKLASSADSSIAIGRSNVVRQTEAEVPSQIYVKWQTYHQTSLQKN